MEEHPQDYSPDDYIDIDLNGQSRPSTANNSPETKWKAGARAESGATAADASAEALGSLRVPPASSSTALPREELAPHVLGRGGSGHRGGEAAKSYAVAMPAAAGSPLDLPLPVVRASDACPGAASKEAAVEQDQIDRARCVSKFSVAASVIVALLGLSLGFAEQALTLVGFGGESLLDAVSSALVLWRFKRPKKRSYLDADAEMQGKLDRDERRERNSSMGIAFLFVLYSVMLLTSSACKWWFWDPETAEHSQEERAAALYGSLLAWPCAVIFGSLAVVKWKLARTLDSKVLEKDALCSLLGAVLAFICAIAALVEEALEGDAEGLEKIMLVDVSFSAAIACILLFEGAHTLYKLVPTSEEHRPLA
mmetsp:Transcript_6355/g.10758  ORF Transcript_6355/g.10758 Transcript_6355/m.10758 type:complete len:367 (+) Transcript_6355:64-1164(+)